MVLQDYPTNIQPLPLFSFTDFDLEFDMLVPGNEFGYHDDFFISPDLGIDKDTDLLQSVLDFLTQIGPNLQAKYTKQADLLKQQLRTNLKSKQFSSEVQFPSELHQIGITKMNPPVQNACFRDCLLVLIARTKVHNKLKNNPTTLFRDYEQIIKQLNECKFDNEFDNEISIINNNRPINEDWANSAIKFVESLFQSNSNDTPTSSEVCSTITYGVGAETRDCGNCRFPTNTPFMVLWDHSKNESLQGTAMGQINYPTEKLETARNFIVATKSFPCCNHEWMIKVTLGHVLLVRIVSMSSSSPVTIPPCILLSQPEEPSTVKYNATGTVLHTPNTNGTDNLGHYSSSYVGRDGKYYHFDDGWHYSADSDDNLSSFLKSHDDQTCNVELVIYLKDTSFSELLHKIQTSNHPFGILPIERDNNCLFSALGFWLGKSQDVVRQEIGNFYKEKGPTFLLPSSDKNSVGESFPLETMMESSALDHLCSTMNFMEYINWIKTDENWGGELELQFAVMLYKINISVVSLNGDKTTLAEPKKYTCSANAEVNDKVIIFFTGNHYDVGITTDKLETLSSCNLLKVKSMQDHIAHYATKRWSISPGTKMATGEDVKGL